MKRHIVDLEKKGYEQQLDRNVARGNVAAKSKNARASASNFRCRFLPRDAMRQAGDAR